MTRGGAEGSESLMPRRVTRLPLCRALLRSALPSDKLACVSECSTLTFTAAAARGTLCGRTLDGIVRGWSQHCVTQRERDVEEGGSALC